MKQVPYEGNRGNSCALSCYTMVARYLLPELDITFEQLAEIADYREGYVVWGFRVWKWMMDRGTHITNYDVIDYDGWVKRGIGGLRESVGEANFRYYTEHTYDLEKVGEEAGSAFGHENFTYVRKEIGWEDVMREFGKSGICDLAIDMSSFRGKEELTLHRVVLIDITEREVVFHDPDIDWSGAYRHAPIGMFEDAVERVGGAELTRYSLE